MPKDNYFSNLIGGKKIRLKNGRLYRVRANRSRFYFPDEWMEFYDSLKTRQKITFNFLINTGARINETRNVKVSDIDFARLSILLRVTKGRDKRTPKIRIIKISSKFAKWLKAVIKHYKLEADDYFPVLSTPAANISMKNHLRKLKFKDWMMFSVHNVRKTLETWLLALDVDSLKVAKHFGHTVEMAGKHYIGEDIFNFDDSLHARPV